MKIKLLNKLNMLIASLLALLGIGACGSHQVKYGPAPMYGVPIEKYGVPTAEYVIRGQVTNEKKQPLKDIEVEVTTEYSAVVYTDADGNYVYRETGFPTDSAKIVVTDKDNVYQADSVTVALDYNRANADDWFEGEATAEVNFSLKKK